LAAESSVLTTSSLASSCCTVAPCRAERAESSELDLELPWELGREPDSEPELELEPESDLELESELEAKAGLSGDAALLVRAASPGLQGAPDWRVGLPGDWLPTDCTGLVRGKTSQASALDSRPESGRFGSIAGLGL
jgi:hypothetical protein